MIPRVTTKGVEVVTHTKHTLKKLITNEITSFYFVKYLPGGELSLKYYETPEYIVTST